MFLHRKDTRAHSSLTNEVQGHSESARARTRYSMRLFNNSFIIRKINISSVHGLDIFLSVYNFLTLLFCKINVYAIPCVK